ncbi:MAG: PEP-CTERM sorting domain-containing protein [Sedimentisphaerales bacterium]
MRGFCICAAIALLAVFFTSVATAGTVIISQGLFESRGDYQDGELYATLSGVPGMPNGVRIGTFCVEMSEPLDLDISYNADVSTAAIKGSTTSQDPLGPKTAWLYYQYYIGNIVIDTGAKATDFQYAIWKLEDEDTQDAADWASISPYWGTEAQAYYDMAMASSWTDIGPVRVLNLGSAPDYPIQDILIIPEPATIGLFMLGGLMVRLAGRKN